MRPNRSLLAFAGLVIVLVSGGCGGSSFQPLVMHRVWENKPSEQVFDAAVRVLHGADFLIAAADKGSGLIATDWKYLARKGKKDEKSSKYRIRLNLLVFQEAGVTQSAALSYKSVVQQRNEDEWIDLASGDDVPADSYREMTRILDDFFLEIQRYCGPSVQRR
jgi:hypothetical protein